MDFLFYVREPFKQKDNRQQFFKAIFGLFYCSEKIKDMCSADYSPFVATFVTFCSCGCRGAHLWHGTSPCQRKRFGGATGAKKKHGLIMLLLFDFPAVFAIRGATS